MEEEDRWSNISFNEEYEIATTKGELEKIEEEKTLETPEIKKEEVKEGIQALEEEKKNINEDKE